MKFKNVNGITEIVLEDNDRIVITIPDNKNKINIERTSDGLDISGDASLINSIKGDGMLEKVYIPPILPQEEIIAKCDEWLEIFKNTLDKFSDMLTNPKYQQEDITLVLSFCTWFKSDGSNEKGKGIDLDLKNIYGIVNEGVTINISENNSDIYSYLVACVLDYYLQKNHNGEKIDTMNWNGILYARKDETSLKAIKSANLNTLLENTELSRIVHSIIANHNLGNRSSQIINNLRNRIKAQVMPKNLEEGINYSRRQFDSITESENKGRVRRLTEQQIVGAYDALKEKNNQ